ncbi:MAG TPA: adenylate/guanylate cyclase domain-containing protein [Mycobacteriales bacterium]|nr:adenylate/guanylate cyclase domain-containing protein [Mycobacteriales bacterium]
MGDTDTVVLVMTDVQGSTRLWSEAPAAMDAAMRRHHEIVHGAVAEYGGWRPVDQGEGDSVFAAFASPSAAMAAVIKLQTGLAAEPWPDAAQIAVRVGLHAGEVIDRDGNLFGDTVNRCARIRSLGSGGQTLMSSAIYELVRDTLPEGVTVQDLGEHRMKDLVRAERIWQLQVVGLPTEFPALLSLERAAHNLPVQTSSFVGREREVAELIDLVRSRRLVSLLGFGGMGKTRLALQVAAELADGSGDGVWFVDLSRVESASRVPTEIATALGVREAGAGADEAVLAYLTDKRLLLVLDNVEQVIDCASFVAQILARAPGVKVLTTSREPLRLQGETEFPLSSMPLPPEGADADAAALSAYDAVRLFVDRATAVKRDFEVTNANAPAVAAICAHLNGHPLAIELAAARVKLLSPASLLARLDSALSVLTGGGRDRPLRHQTLRATIAWSYDALSEPERLLLDRLSVFPGSMTMEAAEAICSEPLADEEPIEVLSALTALVDKSLVRTLEPESVGAEPRFDILASIHDFAAERLATSGDAAALAVRHAAYFATLGQVPPDWTRSDEQRARVEVNCEFHNLTAALAHLQVHGTPEELIGFPWLYYYDLGSLGRYEELLHDVEVVMTRHPQPHEVRVILEGRRAWTFAASLRSADRQRSSKAVVAEAERVGRAASIAFAAAFGAAAAETPEALDDIAVTFERVLAEPEGGWMPSRDECIGIYGAAFANAARWSRPDRALVAARRTVDLDQPDVENVFYRTQLAALYCDRGEGEQAIDVLHDAVMHTHFGRADEHYELRALLVLARGQLLLGDLAAVRRAAEDVLGRGRRLSYLRMLSDARLLLAECDVREGEWASALVHLQEARSLGDDGLRTGALAWRAARCHRALGERELAQAAAAEAWALLEGKEFHALPDVIGAMVERAALSDTPAERNALLAEAERKCSIFALPFGLEQEIAGAPGLTW